MLHESHPRHSAVPRLPAFPFLSASSPFSERKLSDLSEAAPSLHSAESAGFFALSGNDATVAPRILDTLLPLIGTQGFFAMPVTSRIVRSSEGWFVEAERSYTANHQGCPWCGQSYVLSFCTHGCSVTYFCQQCDFQAMYHPTEGGFDVVPGESRKSKPARDTMEVSLTGF